VSRYEAGVIVTVRVEAVTFEEAKVALRAALDDAEEACAKRNVELEWELEDVMHEDWDEADPTCPLCDDWFDSRGLCLNCNDNPEEDCDAKKD